MIRRYRGQKPEKGEVLAEAVKDVGIVGRDGTVNRIVKGELYLVDEWNNTKGIDEGYFSLPAGEDNDGDAPLEETEDE